jgi:hypothetical protein
MKAHLVAIKDGTTTVLEFMHGIRADMKTAGVTSCPALDAMEHPTP